MTTLTGITVPVIAKSRVDGTTATVLAVGYFTDTGEGDAIVSYDDNIFGLGIVDGELCILNNEDYSFSVKKITAPKVEKTPVEPVRFPFPRD